MRPIRLESREFGSLDPVDRVASRGILTRVGGADQTEDMPQADDLPRTRCLELLGSRSLGRIALSHRALPTVVPVAYRLIGDRLVFVSAPDTGSLLAGPRPVVAFQVDEIDPGTFAGWSVVVIGTVEKFAADHPSWVLLGSTVGLLQPGAGNMLAGLTTDHVWGRRFHHINPGGTP